MDQLLDFKKALINKKFASLVDSKQRVEYAIDKIGSIDELRQNVKKFLSKHKKKNMKSLNKSQVYRRKGNELMKTKNFEFALNYYNLAVMFAPFPENSVYGTDNELSFAYTSRALAFFRLKSYANAVYDIDNALKLSLYSMTFENRLDLMLLKVKTLYRLKRFPEVVEYIDQMIELIPCLPIHNDLVQSLIETKDNISGQNIEDQEMETNIDLIENHCKTIDDYISKDIELCETERKGRYYRAVEDIPKREIVLVEKTFAAVLFKAFFRTHCQTCFKNIGYNYLPCAQCSQVVFCDQECLKNAFYHNYECGFADIIADIGANHYILYRIILSVGPERAIELTKQTQQQLESLNELTPEESNFLKFIGLIDHTESYGLNAKAISIHRSLQLNLIFDTFDEFKPKTEKIIEYMTELTTILDVLNFKVLINCFGMFEQMTDCRAYRGEHIGNAICFKSSFFNHSCSSNMFWQFCSQYITAITTEDIKSGQELSISYGPHSCNQSFDERQEMLKKRYFFDCSCSACLSEAKHMPTLECHYCEDGFFIYGTDWTESLCLVCGKRLEISSIVKMVEEMEESFNHWINEFELRSNSETLLLKAETFYSNICRFVYSKSDKMIEINAKLSRSFQSIGNFSKAMIYRKNILQSLDDKQSFRYCLEVVVFSRLYYHSLFKQRKSFILDDEWKDCLKITSEAIDVLNEFKKRLIIEMSDETKDSDDLKTIVKAIQLIDRCLKSKEQQICLISKLNSN